MGSLGDELPFGVSTLLEILEAKNSMEQGRVVGVSTLLEILEKD